MSANPTAEWIARQITEAFPWDHAPRYLIRDRDTYPKPTIIPNSVTISNSDAIGLGTCQRPTTRKAGCSTSLRIIAKTNGNTISLAT